MDTTRKNIAGYPDCENNVDSTRKLDAVEMSIQKLTRKIFELELFERMAKETEFRLCQKEEEAMEAKRTLDELHYQKLERMDNYCDEIWRFSSSNDLYSIFDKYLDTSKRIFPKPVTFDIELDPEILRLKKENDELKEQLSRKKKVCENLEKNLFQSEIELQIAESYRDNNPEIIRMKKNIEKLRENIEIIDANITLIEEEFFEAKPKPNVSPVVDKKYDFVKASELIEKSETEDTIKRRKFSVKRESGISRKLASRTAVRKKKFDPKNE